MKNQRVKWLMVLLPLSMFGQRDLSLKEAISFGLANHQNIKNANLDFASAELRIKEIKSAGLPQVNANLNMMGNPILQKVFLPAKFFNPEAPDNAAPIPAKFGVNFSNSLAAGVNQLVFDGSYLLGVKAAELLRELNQKNTNATKVQVVENITKAYYQTIIAQERIKLLDVNLERLDLIIEDTKKLNVAGFVEQIDIDRLEVQKNNLSTEKDKITNLIELSNALLKFQMGMDQSEIVKCSDDLRTIDLQTLTVNLSDFAYSNRIEISQLETSQKLANMDIENQKRGYWPKVFAFGNLGMNQGTMKFNPFSKWFLYSNIGVQVQAPIWDSNLKKHKLDNARITVQKLENTQKFVQSSIDLQIKQANTMLKNAVKSMNVQQANLKLAQNVVDVSKQKYKAGLGTNMEVLNAESTLKEAQTNYFASLFDAVLAKVDLDKALGKFEIN